MKQLRQSKNIRAEEVAYKVGISSSTIRNWEQGRTVPKLRIDQLEKLLKLYDVSFESFCDAVKESFGEAYGA